MNTRGYYLAQICLRGHVISREIDDRPERNQKFCSQCGAPTITTCQACMASIRGRYYKGDPIYDPDWKPPSFCHECGRAYPWTAETLRAAQEYVDEDPNLTNEEKSDLKEDINDIVLDTPRSSAAANRLKKLLARAGKGTAKGLRELLVDIMSEAVKKITFPE